MNISIPREMAERGGCNTPEAESRGRWDRREPRGDNAGYYRQLLQCQSESWPGSSVRVDVLGAGDNEVRQVSEQCSS